MIGNIIRRGAHSRRLKFEAGPRDPVTGERRTRFVTVRGTKKDAQAKLRELLTEIDKGSYIEPSQLTITEHVRARVTHSGRPRAKSASRPPNATAN